MRFKISFLLREYYLTLGSKKTKRFPTEELLNLYVAEALKQHFIGLDPYNSQHDEQTFVNQVFFQFIGFKYIFWKHEYNYIKVWYKNRSDWMNTMNTA